MAGISAADVLVLFARLAFVALLYVLIGVVLLSLGRTILASGRRDELALGRERHEAHDGNLATAMSLIAGASGDARHGRIVPLDGPLVFGRRPDCDVTMSDTAVSGHHARVSWDGGGWLVEDLGSTNGTFVNGQRLALPTLLCPGDEVTIGGSTWRVEGRAS